MDPKPTITIEDFAKLDIRIGTVLSAEKVAGADKLLILKIDLGEEVPRQILAGIAEHVGPETLMGKQIPVVANLASRVLRGHESQGMILAVGTGDTFALLHPSTEVPVGSRAK
ncbi:MAG: methionine--tRNA ligase subunit beta [Minisyncoccota bacterium]